MALRRLNWLVLAFLLALGLVLQSALPARACSCMIPDPFAGLADADGAFVGTVTEVDRGPAPLTNSAQLIDYHFEVEESVKGDIGDTVVVNSAANGASCGLELPVGTRAGLLLDQVDGEWQGNMCWTVDADALLLAAEGPPEPVQGSPPHLVVITEMGNAGVVALDRQGQIVGYGEGPSPQLVSACPDEETFIGLTPDGIIKVWSFTDLAVVGEYPLDADVVPRFTHLVCAGPGGRPYLAVTILSGVEQTTLIRYADGESEVLSEGIESLVATAQGPIALAADGTVLAVDAESGALTPLTEPLGDVHGRLSAVVPSPDGSRVAVGIVDWNVSPVQGRAVAVDLETGTAAELEIACDVYPVWLGNDQVSIWDSCNESLPAVYTTDLDLIGEGQMLDYMWGWNVTDEDGAVFYAGGLGLTILEPGAVSGTEFGPAMGYAQAALLVPESARATWTGADFVPASIPEQVGPPETVPPPGEVPIDAFSPGYDSPVWLFVVGAVVVAGVLWLLVRSPGDSDPKEPCDLA